MNDAIEEARAQGFREGLLEAAEMAEAEEAKTAAENWTSFGTSFGEMKTGTMRALDSQARRLRALAASKT